MIGGASNPTLGWSLIIGGIILLVIGILLGIKDYIEDSIVCLFIGIFVTTLIFGIINLIDNRIPIVKATINETVSFQEIDEKYKLRTVEGEIYTFEVKISPDEWQLHLNE